MIDSKEVPRRPRRDVCQPSGCNRLGRGVVLAVVVALQTSLGVAGAVAQVDSLPDPVLDSLGAPLGSQEIGSNPGLAAPSLDSVTAPLDTLFDTLGGDTFVGQRPNPNPFSPSSGLGEILGGPAVDTAIPRLTPPRAGTF